MKKTALLVLAVLVIGILIGYAIGYDEGASRGYLRGYAQSAADNVPIARAAGAAEAVKHHYEFKQNGVSIFRFDLDTGESCWLQLGGADAHEEDHLTNPMTQCSK